MWRRTASRLSSCRISRRYPLSKYNKVSWSRVAQSRSLPALTLFPRCSRFSSSDLPGDKANSLDVAAVGMRVKVNMKMALPDGTVLDETAGVEFVCGVGQMLPGVDRVVQGMRIGESREVILEGADAFGEKDDSMILEVPLADLPADCKVGDALSTSDDGKGVIVAIKGDTATVDHNHILVGRTVVFIAKLLEVGQVPTLSCEVTKPGDGVSYPKNGDTLTMHYTGRLAATGEVFDSSRGDGKQPFIFTIGVGQVISGWDQGVMHMSLGERSILKIPSQMAYGEKGIGGAAPPNADLIFDLELLEIN